MFETFEFALAELPVLFAVFAFVFGAIVGSFLNVCIYRIPKNRSIVVPGSTCACGQPIRWFDNLPILSWILLRGRARCCGASFSVRYPAVEALTGAVFLIAWLNHPPAVALAGFLFLSFLICATFIDLDHMIIPDRFSIGGALIAVFLSFWLPSLHGVEGPRAVAGVFAVGHSLLGMLLGAGLVYWIGALGEAVFKKPAMGEGDVKFVGFIGAFCGWQGAFFAMFGGAVVGSLAIIPLALAGRFRKDPAKREAEEARRKELETTVREAVARGDDAAAEEAYHELTVTAGHIPFGPMLAVAGAAYFLGLDRWVDPYFAELWEILTLFGGY